MQNTFLNSLDIELSRGGLPTKETEKFIQTGCSLQWGSQVDAKEVLLKILLYIPDTKFKYIYFVKNINLFYYFYLIHEYLSIQHNHFNLNLQNDDYTLNAFFHQLYN